MKNFLVLLSSSGYGGITVDYGDRITVITVTVHLIMDYGDRITGLDYGDSAFNYGITGLQ